MLDPSDKIPVDAYDTISDFKQMIGNFVLMNKFLGELSLTTKGTLVRALYVNKKRVCKFLSFN